MIGGFLLVRKKIKSIAKKRIKKEARRAAEDGTLPFRAIPPARPFVRPIKTIFPKTVDAIVDSGLIDNAIEREIDRQLILNPGMRRRLERMDRAAPIAPPATTRQEQAAMAVDLGIDLIADAELMEEVAQLQEAIEAERFQIPLFSGRDFIRRSQQFAFQELQPRKRTRKKTKTDKKMAKALAQANKELRKKNGELRKGKTQADVMKRAHRIRKKMS